LSEKERIYVARRLTENPKLAWAKTTRVWRRGPARWIRQTDPGSHFPKPPVGALRAIAALCVLLSCLLLRPASSTHPCPTSASPLFADKMNAGASRVDGQLHLADKMKAGG